MRMPRSSGGSERAQTRRTHTVRSDGVTGEHRVPLASMGDAMRLVDFECALGCCSDGADMGTRGSIVSRCGRFNTFVGLNGAREPCGGRARLRVYRGWIAGSAG